jgi:hypothetical protein
MVALEFNGPHAVRVQNTCLEIIVAKRLNYRLGLYNNVIASCVAPNRNQYKQAPFNTLYQRLHTIFNVGVARFIGLKQSLIQKLLQDHT